MSIVSFFKVFKSNIFKRSIVFILTFIFIYFLLLTAPVTKKYDIKEGEIAKFNIKAPRDIKDEFTTKSLIKQAVDGVTLQYTKKSEIAIEVINDMNSYFIKVRDIKSTAVDDKEKISKLKLLTQVTLTDEEYIELLKLKDDEVSTLNNLVVNTLREAYDTNNIMKDKPDDIKKTQEAVLFKINSNKQTPKVINEIAETIVTSEIKPNYFYNEDKTNQLKDEAMKSVTPFVIKKDQIIVQEGEPVEKYQIELLKSAGLYNTNSKFDWYVYVSMGVIILLVMILQWYYLYKYKNELYIDLSKMILINILNCISLVLARTLSIISPFLIPFACIPMTFTLLLDYEVSLWISIVNCIIISSVVGFNIEITLLSIINTVVGSIILKKMQQRNDILYATLYIALMNAIFTSSVGFLLSNNITDVLSKTAYSFAASVLSGVLTIGFLPFFESTFDIVTTMKLLELSNPNNPLLKRLLLEAPGTYHHSILVGNLAEMAADAVGGNSVLARVASYYHDVGKIKRPYFFKENQINNDNPHNKITPNLSTLIITSHVKDGVELAKEYKIPKVIQDIMEQHHGTTLVKYFYLTMKNASDKPDEINPEDFMYDGPIPETKEAGIIMMADSVEASVRSIVEPTNGKIEEMVNNIIKARLNEGQLNNCDLTLKDLEKIREAFLKVFIGIYHKRIEYPEDKWSKKDKE